jgi:hypothetical protein
LKRDAASPSPELPKGSKNHRNPCKGRSVIRYENDDKEGHRRGDPVLDEDFARTYRPCKAWGAHGTDYCGVHGGSAPQTIMAAKRRLALTADDVAAAIAQIALDERVIAETRLKAAAQILDRIGIRGGVDVSLETPKWQGILSKMFGSPDVEPEGEPEDEPELEEIAPKPRKATRSRTGPK